LHAFFKSHTLGKETMCGKYRSYFEGKASGHLFFTISRIDSIHLSLLYPL
jgi:hypothetical protein